MCCFTGPVKDVSSTQLFARALAAGRQLLVYGLTVSVDAEVAMVLPLPTPAGTGEGDVRFVDLSGCPDFFKSLDGLFPAPRQAGRSLMLSAAPAPANAPRLEVKQVGDFEASFAPSLADLSRLDPRFRLPDELWRQLPECLDGGFAVFKLRGRGTRRVHPMGFDFPRRDPDALFFPTVHVHDGAVHERARFNHQLYAQPPGDWASVMTWARAGIPTSKLDRKARGFVGEEPVFRTRLDGELPNHDTWLRGDVLRGRVRRTVHAEVRVLTAWEHLAGPARGAPTSPAGLDPTVWKELQVTEPQRRAACARASEALEARLSTEPGVLPLDDTLPEVWPAAYSSGLAVAPPVPRGCLVRVSCPGKTVMSLEARVAFRALPGPAALAVVREVLERHG